MKYSGGESLLATGFCTNVIMICAGLCPQAPWSQPASGVRGQGTEPNPSASTEWAGLGQASGRT